ncbi:hypothetical protein HMPREF3293_01900 [Christensenella minuta]|uniref:Uncharacterized protein n=1 Tax=Christensenella minuta TaxID=626937 RepID=A0A136Q3P7_9FIRM|nr:hypothetical protein HMPREF3293_01900 [Christensenella minuta]
MKIESIGFTVKNSNMKEKMQRIKDYAIKNILDKRKRFSL